MSVTTTAARMPREQKARQMGRQGYAISQNVYCPGLFYVQPPEGPRGPITPYIVDLNERICNCPDFTGRNQPGICKHILFVEICRRFWISLCRKPAPIRNRRHFSARHLQLFRALAAPPATVSNRWTQEEYQRRMAEDFC